MGLGKEVRRKGMGKRKQGGGYEREVRWMRRRKKKDAGRKRDEKGRRRMTGDRRRSENGGEDGRWREQGWKVGNEVKKKRKGEKEERGNNTYPL